MPGADPSLVQFLDAIDRRQLTASQLSDVASTATLAEMIAAFNAFLETQRTK
jgi:hypothetical protein